MWNGLLLSCPCPYCAPFTSFVEALIRCGAVCSICSVWPSQMRTVGKYPASSPSQNILCQGQILSAKMPILPAIQRRDSSRLRNRDLYRFAWRGRAGEVEDEDQESPACCSRQSPPDHLSRWASESTSTSTKRLPTPPYASTVETGLLGPFLIAPPINGAPHGSKTTSRLDDKADAAQTQTRVRNMFLLGLMPTL
jgi:hypothetical protein